MQYQPVSVVANGPDRCALAESRYTTEVIRGSAMALMMISRTE